MIVVHTDHASLSYNPVNFKEQRWRSLHMGRNGRVTRSKMPMVSARNGVEEELAVRIMFAAGGTGGHVFPAIAIADALTTAYKSVTVQFVGTRHRLEATVVPRAGYSLRHIPAAPLRRPIFLSPQNLLLPFRLLHSILAAVHLLLTFRPHAVVGTGGYISGPICFAALLCGCPYVIQEQNACPGLTNKILASFATTVFVAFVDALAHFPSQKCIVSGNPVRWTLQQLVPKTTAVRHFFPSSTSLLASDETAQLYGGQCEVVLIQGGSLGAKSLNQAVIGFVERMLDKHPKRHLIWQTGSKHFKGVLDKLKHHERLFVCEFLLDMNLAYSAADLVVACSGAITCSELLTLGKPSILVPLQYVADNHQRNNAAVLQRAGASRTIDDTGLTPEKLEGAINELLGEVFA
ncbi:hypothetical protein L7F22_023272 [Adiantum nelumboides]|nr:hypothetical protein [Adiantum nelumboides]